MDNKLPTQSPASNPGTDLSIIAGLIGELRTSIGSIAVLHERDANRERRMVESEERTVEALDEIKHQIVRVHERLDQINTSVREEVSSVRREMQQITDAHRTETTEQIAKAIDPMWVKIDANSKKIEATKNDLDGWINRVKGGWFIGSICAGVFQACIVAVLVWVLGEVKTTHDWRITMEAQQRAEQRRGEPK